MSFAPSCCLPSGAPWPAHSPSRSTPPLAKIQSTSFAVVIASFIRSAAGSSKPVLPTTQKSLPTKSLLYQCPSSAPGSSVPPVLVKSTLIASLMSPSLHNWCLSPLSSSLHQRLCSAKVSVLPTSLFCRRLCRQPTSPFSRLLFFSAVSFPFSFDPTASPPPSYCC